MIKAFSDRSDPLPPAPSRQGRGDPNPLIEEAPSTLGGGWGGVAHTSRVALRKGLRLTIAYFEGLLRGGAHGTSG